FGCLLPCQRSRRRSGSPENAHVARRDRGDRDRTGSTGGPRRRGRAHLPTLAGSVADGRDHLPDVGTLARAGSSPGSCVVDTGNGPATASRQFALASTPQLARSLLAEVNAMRRAHGLRALRLSGPLTEAAYAHAQALAVAGQFGTHGRRPAGASAAGSGTSTLRAASAAGAPGRTCSGP